jgi:hypothetical protein
MADLWTRRQRLRQMETMKNLEESKSFQSLVENLIFAYQLRLTKEQMDAVFYMHNVDPTGIIYEQAAHEAARSICSHYLLPPTDGRFPVPPPDGATEKDQEAYEERRTAAKRKAPTFRQLKAEILEVETWLVDGYRHQHLHESTEDLPASRKSQGSLGFLIEANSTYSPASAP